MYTHRFAPYILLATMPLAFPSDVSVQAQSGKAAPKDQRELHVVSIYEGVYKTGGKIHGGKAAVTVKRPGKSVTLVLTAYEPVQWEITLASDTQLDKVILGGSNRQAVKGVQEKTVVVEAFRNGASPMVPFAGYQIDSARFRAFVHKLERLTKQEINSFQGAYGYRHEAPFIIDGVQNDPRLSADYPKPTPVGELPKLEFKGIHYTVGNRAHDVHVAYGDFTLTGPKLDSLRPLPKDVKRLALDPVTKKYYGIAYPAHEVVEVDLEKQATKTIKPGLEVPRLSWPSDITFDTKRQRLLVTSSAGGGYLYAFHPGTGKWSVLVEKPGTDALTYHPKNDVLYGVGFQHEEDGDRPVLYQFNAEGAVVKKTPLGDPIAPGSLSRGPGVCGTQLIPAEDYVVISASPYGLRSSEEDGPRQTYIYLLDPKSGKVQLAWKGN